MPWIDWIILFVLLWTSLSGFWGGFIYKIGSIIGGVIGIGLAIRFYDFFHGGPFVQIGTFLAITIVSMEVVGFFFRLLDHLFHLFAIIPGLKLLNRIGGGLIGFLQGAIFLSLIFWFVNLKSIALPPQLLQSIDHSLFVPWLLSFGNLFIQLFPSFNRPEGGRSLV